MTDNTQPEAGSTHIIRYALELGLLWIDGDGRGKVREALDALNSLEAQLEAVGAGGVSGPLMGQPQAMPDLSALTERGAKAWAGFDAQGYRDWVLRNLPKGSIIGNGEWWADHLTSWAKRFVKAAPQPSPTPQADSQPEDENDAHNFAICQHFDHWLIEKGALLTPHSEESDGPMAPALNWIASVEAMVAARAPADSVTAPAGGIPGNFITHRASWRKALETSKAHATGDDVTYWDHELRAFDRSFDRLWELMQASPTPPAEQQAQSAGPCVICGSDEPFTGTCGSGDPRALCKQAAPKAQTDSVPAIQGEMNVQLDIDSNHSAPGQQRDVARAVALGQPMGNGQDQAAGRPSAQGDKLLTVAERNIRSFLRSAQFKCESDREAALNCVDVLWAAARDPADSVLEDAARLDWLESNSQTNIERVRYLGATKSIYEVTPYDSVSYDGETLRAAIDAARKQGGAI